MATFPAPMRVEVASHKRDPTSQSSVAKRREDKKMGLQLFYLFALHRNQPFFSYRDQAYPR
jgi:hypothetical protein